eukprot:9502507-Pyramimonas_sp.AAC.1
MHCPVNNSFCGHVNLSPHFMRSSATACRSPSQTVQTCRGRMRTCPRPVRRMTFRIALRSWVPVTSGRRAHLPASTGTGGSSASCRLKICFDFSFS